MTHEEAKQQAKAYAEQTEYPQHQGIATKAYFQCWKDMQAVISCPFCGQDDYDKEGLKYHLVNYCEQFKADTNP